MEVLSSNDGYLTDIEVLEYLREKQCITQRNSGKDDAEKVETAVIDFLSTTPKILAPKPKATKGNAKSSNLTANVSRYLAEMERLCALDPESEGSLASVKITETELLQLCNHQPETELDLFVIIDFDRLSEAQSDTILEVAKTYFSE